MKINLGALFQISKVLEYILKCIFLTHGLHCHVDCPLHPLELSVGAGLSEGHPQTVTMCEHHSPGVCNVLQIYPYISADLVKSCVRNEKSELNSPMTLCIQLNY